MLMDLIFLLTLPSATRRSPRFSLLHLLSRAFCLSPCTLHISPVPMAPIYFVVAPSFAPSVARASQLAWL